MQNFFIPSLSPFDYLKGLSFSKKISAELAEIVGLVIGDGHIAYSKDKRGYIFQLYGDHIKDRQYFDRHVFNIFHNVFGLKIRPRYIHKSVYGYQFMSKALVLFLSKNFSIPLGKKTHTARIPLLKSTKLQKACLKGLIDADFGIVFKNEYPVLQGWFANKNLVSDISKIFSRLGIKHTTDYDKGYFDKRTGKFYNRHKVAVGRIKEIDKWYNIIGTGHPVMKLKYLCWKRKHKVLKDADIINIFAPRTPQSMRTANVV